MAKRVRGSHSTHRPGGLAPVKPARPITPVGPTGSAMPAGGPAWDADIDAALNGYIVESTEVTFSEPVSAAPAPARPRRRVAVKADSLEARVAAENIYVREDLRRIAVVTGILLAGLATCWVLFVLLDLLDLY